MTEQGVEIASQSSAHRWLYDQWQALNHLQSYRSPSLQCTHYMSRRSRKAFRVATSRDYLPPLHAAKYRPTKVPKLEQQRSQLCAQNIHHLHKLLELGVAIHEHLFVCDYL